MEGSSEDFLDIDGVPVPRRRFLGFLGAVSSGFVAVSKRATGRSEGSGDDFDIESAEKIRNRLRNEYEKRVRYSVRLIQATNTSSHDSNDRISEDFVVSKFGKGLPHDDDTGLADPDAYDALVRACERGEGYEDIPKAYDGTRGDDIPGSVTLSEEADGELNSRPLVQPESAWTYTTEGASTAQLRIASPPEFDDPETGAEMVELYWRALTRDVNFRDYEDDELVQEAAAELDSIEGYNGPGSEGTVTPENVFRGVTPGSEKGPYVSQFLWKDRDLGGGTVDQKIQPQASEETPTDYMTTVEDWLKVQKGIPPGLDEKLPGNEFDTEKRHIVTGRDLCERVHDDPPFRQVQKAAQVLVFTMNAPLNDGIPYSLKPSAGPETGGRDLNRFESQTTLPFNDFGPLYIEKKVLEAAEHGQKAAWHKKWNVHRRLRPEEYGGRVQAVKGGGNGGGDLSRFDTNGEPGIQTDEYEKAVLAQVRDEEIGGEPVTSDDVESLGERLETEDGGSASLGPGGPDSDFYGIPDNLLDSLALERTKEKYGSYLLPQAYAEGSPTHPSYPAGHSVVAGAGVTVLKAFFDGDYVFPSEQKVVPTRDGGQLVSADRLNGDVLDIGDTLTVRGELNKLASNMALGRNRAGIHYRTDGIEGLRLGEQAAIRFLEDQLSLPEGIDTDVELSLRTFDGESVTVSPVA